MELAKVTVAATTRQLLTVAKGQEGPEWLKCSLKMAPMVLKLKMFPMVL